MNNPLERFRITKDNLDKGREITNISLPVFETPLEIRNICLGNYFVAYFRNETVLNSNCLESSPNWMYEMKDIIEDVPLSKVLLDFSFYGRIMINIFDQKKTYRNASC